METLALSLTSHLKCIQGLSILDKFFINPNIDLILIIIHLTDVIILLLVKTENIKYNEIMDLSEG